MIVFTEYLNPFSKDKDVLHWRAECYPDEGRMFPVGVAYGVCIPKLKNVCQMNFIMVADQWRRKGVADNIVKACLEKWPNMQFTDGMDKRGKQLVSKYQPQGDQHF